MRKQKQVLPSLGKRGMRRLIFTISHFNAHCNLSGIFFNFRRQCSTPHGFKMHIEQEHNTEHYLFFFMHLLHKPVTEHTGQESHVYDLYRRRQFSFFPVGERFKEDSDA